MVFLIDFFFHFYLDFMWFFFSVRFWFAPFFFHSFIWFWSFEIYFVHQNLVHIFCEHVSFTYFDQIRLNSFISFHHMFFVHIFHPYITISPIHSIWFIFSFISILNHTNFFRSVWNSINPMSFHFFLSFSISAVSRVLYVRANSLSTSVNIFLLPKKSKRVTVRSRWPQLCESRKVYGVDYVFFLSATTTMTAATATTTHEKSKRMEEKWCNCK